MSKKVIAATSLVAALVLARCSATALSGSQPLQEATEEPAPTDEPDEPEETEETDVPSAEPAVPEAIEVGAVVPLSGPFAGGGGQVAAGYELAVEEINEAGGIYVEAYDEQLPINLVILDDESDPSFTARHLQTHLAEREVVAYLGGFGSSLHEAGAAIAEANQVPYLGVAFALWGVHQEGNDYLFSPFEKSPDMATETFAMLDATIPEDERPTRVAIFQEQTAWGVELGGLWVEEAEAAGYEVVAYEEYPVLADDFSDIILSARDAEAEILLALPVPPDGIALYQQMVELDFNPAVSLFIRAPDVPAWSAELGENGDYVLLMPGWHNGMTFEGVDELNAMYVEMKDRPADPMVGPAYAVVQILADSIERAGTLDREAIRDAIADTDMETVIGPVTFRDDGTGDIQLPILQYQDGQPELVWPLRFATADFIYPAPEWSDR